MPKAQDNSSIFTSVLKDVFEKAQSFKQRLVHAISFARMNDNMDCGYIDQCCRLGKYSWDKKNALPSWSEIEKDHNKINGDIFCRAAHLFGISLENVLPELDQLIALQKSKKLNFSPVTLVAGCPKKVTSKLTKDEIERLSCVVGLFRALK